MLVCRLARTTPGRGEADLGIITITSLRPTRGGRRRMTAHIVTGPGHERIEQHVEIPDPPHDCLGIDLLHYVLGVARAQRDLGAQGVHGVVLPADFAVGLTKLARQAIAASDRKPSADFEAQLDELEDRLPLNLRPAA